MEWDEAVVVALGGNLSGGLSGGFDSSATILRRALDAFPEIGLIVKAKSSLWGSKAWPDPDDPPFVNAVAVVETRAPPAAVLAALHELEARFGRVRTLPNAPRTLDLDLIAYGRLIDAGPPILPHPRARRRRFVMGPLAEIAPGWRHPETGETAAVLAARAEVGADARPMDSL